MKPDDVEVSVGDEALGVEVKNDFSDSGRQEQSPTVAVDRSDIHS
jgi:hypothetical protein